jgi:hypothetical protein
MYWRNKEKKDTKRVNNEDMNETISCSIQMEFSNGTQQLTNRSKI